MKVLYVPCRFLARPVGGGNIHAQSLAILLRRRGFQVAGIFPAESRARFAQEGGWTTWSYRNASPSAALEDFKEILREEKPERVHFYAFRPELSALFARESKRRGIPVVFSYISAETGCGRKTLLRWGREPCSEIFNLNLCASCALHGYGLPRVVSELIGRTPVSVGSSLSGTKMFGKAGTALRMRAQIQASQRSFKAFLDMADHIVASAEWVKDLLVGNGVRPDKITLSRVGIPHGAPTPSVQTKDSSFPPRIAMVGRAHPQKGFHILIPALRREPGLKIKLDVFSNGLRYLQKLSGEDPRIALHPLPVPIDKLAALLQDYDALAVPSQWLETGPLVVLEAFAAGIPVIGSDWGGISELVQAGVNGLLVNPPHRLESWQAVLRRICAEPELLRDLGRNVSPPRAMDETAEEMEAVYRRLLSGSSPLETSSCSNAAPASECPR